MDPFFWLHEENWRVSMSKLKHSSIYRNEEKWNIWRNFYPLLSHNFLKVSFLFFFHDFVPSSFCYFRILVAWNVSFFSLSSFNSSKNWIKIRSTTNQQFESFKIRMLQIYNECNKFFKMSHHLILPSLILMEFGRIICFLSFYQNSFSHIFT